MQYSAALLIISIALAGDAFGAVSAKPMPECMSNETWDRLAHQLQANPPHLTSERLPKGSKLGRCLLIVEGKRLIDGKCAYSIDKDGSFGFDGPRQIYPGIDYPECFQGAATFTTDYFVQVERVSEKELGDGSSGPGWRAFWNEEVGSNHAEGFLGPVKRDGACFSNDKTKICLWKK